MSTPYGFAAISELAEGQYVLAYDEATGELIYAPILATWVHEDPLIVHLTIDGERIETTPEHPFRLANGDWVPAAALEIGSQVQRANGTTGLVAAIEFSHDSQLMYNLTVAAAHTYFVGDGQWLVHNKYVKFDHRQVQKKYQHAADFGITGNYNQANHKAFVQALDTHVHGSNTQVIQGTYRGQSAIHYYDPSTDLIVFTYPNGDFWSGWRIGGKQKTDFLATGDLR